MFIVADLVSLRVKRQYIAIEKELFREQAFIGKKMVNEKCFLFCLFDTAFCMYSSA